MSILGAIPALTEAQIQNPAPGEDIPTVAYTAPGVALAIGDQRIISIITVDAVRELRLKRGQIAIALIKSTGVMIVLPD